MYHVLTNNPKWCGGLIPDLCGYSNIPSIGEHKLKYRNNPTITNALEHYYKVDFVEDNTYLNQYNGVDTDSYYVLEYIEPYDD